MRMNEPVGMRSTLGEPVPLVGVEAKGKVEGLLFELTVEQRYRNATETNIEAVYTFPLPHDAVLLDMEVAIGGKWLKGVVVEKRQAEQSYEQAIDEGHTAIMLERAGDGLLTANFGNLMAGEEAVVRYSIAQLLRLDHDAVRVTIPTVIAPRYGDPSAGGLQLHQAPTHDLGVHYPFTLAIELCGAISGGKIASPTHAIALEPHGDRLVVTFDAASSLDRDFVLTIADVEQRSLAIVGEDGDECVALASFRIGDDAKREALPLRLKMLLDCSGSMNGDSIAAARNALQRVLASLDARDYFSVSRFGTSTEHKTMGLVAAGEKTVRQAARSIAEIQADLGGTEMQQALEAVFAIDAEGEAADVLLVTDGEIWATDDLIARARSERQRVFVVGVGSAPAQSVLRRLAEATGGACAFVTPNEDPEETIVRMVERLRAPRLGRVDVIWPDTPAWCTTPPTGVFAGETVHVFAGFRKAPRGDAILQTHGRDREAIPLASVTLPSPSPATALARIAAAMRIATLEDASARLELALRHSLLTDQTNIVVVHERAEAERAQGMPALAHVPQMVAAGWGGMGSVQSSVMFSLDVSECETMIPYAMSHEPAVARHARYRSSDDANLHTVPALLRALDRSVSSAGLPETFDDLQRLGLAIEILDGLRALVASGYDELTIVQALLVELATRASSLQRGREFVRCMCRRGGIEMYSPDLDAEVAGVVAGLRARRIVGDKMLDAVRETVR